MADVKRVYTFGNKEAEGNGKMRELLGGKGANLAEMNLIGIPMELKCRSIDAETHFGPLDRHAIDDLLVMEGVVREWLKH